MRKQRPRPTAKDQRARVTRAGALARRIIWLYPRAWRARYADEMIALLDQSPARWRDVVDLASGAVWEGIYTNELFRLNAVAVWVCGCWLLGLALASALPVVSLGLTTVRTSATVLALAVNAVALSIMAGRAVEWLWTRRPATIALPSTWSVVVVLTIGFVALTGLEIHERALTAPADLEERLFSMWWLRLVKVWMVASFVADAWARPDPPAHSSLFGQSSGKARP